MALRVDFLGRCGELGPCDGRRLDEIAYAAEHQVLVAQMSAEAMHAALVGPTRQVGLELEPGLAARMLADVAGSPGALPLIEDTLDLLWQRRLGRWLTQAAYDAAGGVTGALLGRADRLIDGLDAAAQAVARRLPQRTTPGDCTRAAARAVAEHHLDVAPGAPFLNAATDMEQLRRISWPFWTVSLVFLAAYTVLVLGHAVWERGRRPIEYHGK